MNICYVKGKYCFFNMPKKLSIYIILLLFCTNLMAQQTPLFSQYVLSEFVVNPSVAGVDGMTSISLIGRKQWIGWEFAPENYAASVSTRILKSQTVFKAKRKPGPTSFKRGASGRVGLGASILKDRNGAVNRTSVNFAYAYHVPMYNSQLSFGLSLLMNQFSIDREFAELGDPNDPVNALIGSSTYSPDAGFGVDYSTPDYHIGLSAFNLFQSPVKFGETTVNYRELRQQRHYYVLGTYKGKIESNNQWTYEPSVLLRGTENLKGVAELSLRFIYNEEYWAGVSMRTTKEFVALLGLKANKLYFGYSFDYGFNDIAQLSYGSHEVVMAIKLGDSTRRYRFWQRY